MLAGQSFAQTLLDDTWADGTRNNTNLPTESAWYASTAASLAATTGTMTGTPATSNRTWWTYFTATPTVPAQLSVGQTLKVTLKFIPTGVNNSNTGTGLRIGLYNHSAGTRTTSDGDSPVGANVSGYMLNMNFGQTFGIGAPLQIKKRTNAASADLMGTASDYTQIGAGGGNSGTLAFTNGGIYTLVFTATRNASSVDVTITFTGSNGLNVSATASDTSSLVDAFDAFSVRPGNATQTATSFQFTECKVEVLAPTNQPPSITTQPQSQTVVAGQTATFTVAATSGSAMTYQWFKDAQPIAGATNATLSLANVQSANAGSYTVTVTNTTGPTASNAATLTVVTPAAPSITTPPQSQTVLEGQSATFTVVASGSPTLTYQWKKGSAAIAGATTSTLTLINVQSGDAGSYTVDVTNSVSTVTSAAATLTVTPLVAPSITAPPQSQTANAGASVTLTVTASGTAPLSYQWMKNGVRISGATSASLTLANVQANDAGNFAVVVSNDKGSATSAAATLTVNNAPPVISTQPNSQAALTGANVNLSVVAVGAAPLSYQWRKDGTAISGATGATLALTNVQPDDSGAYSVQVSNAYGNATSSDAMLTVSDFRPYSSYNLTGFATTGTGTTGGGVISETSPAYAKVTTPLELANAVISFNKNQGVKVIEIMNDLNLGWNEIGAAVQALTSNPFSSSATPVLHPALINAGVSKLDIKGSAGGLTIFSANGATIKHCTFNIKSTSNIIVRNLKFDEMWEWDEATKGNYDKNDWDFIDLGNGGDVQNIWVDHCTFTKTYDGILDTKAGSSAITISWCKYTGDDGATNPNSFVRQQIAALEANKASYPFYNFLRSNGYGVEDIVTIIQGHDKTHLAGANSLDADNATISMTFHHLWLKNVWDRCVPRLRAGNVHDYNIFVDDVGVLAARRLRDTRAAAMSASTRATLEGTYNFAPPVNGSISTEGGALLVEKSFYSDCIYPLRNNQTDPSDPTYTGKIAALDTIYSFLNSNGATTTIRGNSTDPGNPLGPFQAAIIPFSWNNLSNNQLPYLYTLDDPAQLPTILAGGAGAGALTWLKANWLKTTYADDAPTITQQPVSQTVNLGGTASFGVGATSPSPLSYQWQKNGVAISGATNSTYSITALTWADAGSYSVILSNSSSSLTSAAANLTIPGASYVMGFGLDPATNGAANADPDHDGMSNQLEWFLNGDPTHSDPSVLPILKQPAVSGAGWTFEFNRRADAAGMAYAVQSSTDLKTWTNVADGVNGATITVSSFNATLDHVVVTIPSTAGKLFARLRL